MSVAFKVLPDAGVVLVRFSGEVDGAQQIASFVDYARHPQFDGRQHALLDLSDCTLENSYFEDIQRLAYRMRSYYQVRDRCSRTSVYAPGDVVFGMSRMYQSITDGVSPWKLGVFRTRAEALRFLDIPPDSACEARVMAVWDG